MGTIFGNPPSRKCAISDGNAAISTGELNMRNRHLVTIPDDMDGSDTPEVEPALEIDEDTATEPGDLLGNVPDLPIGISESGGGIFPCGRRCSFACRGELHPETY